MKARATAIVLCSLFASACGDPDAPRPYLDVAAPEWAAGIKVERALKRSCRLENAGGESFEIDRPTDIGNGLTAVNGRYECHVTDPADVTCRWDYAGLDRCRKPNPVHAAYRADGIR